LILRRRDVRWPLITSSVKSTHGVVKPVDVVLLGDRATALLPSALADNVSIDLSLVVLRFSGGQRK
jgi:hypothetical protein